MSALREAAGVVPDREKCRWKSDTSAASGAQTADPVEEVSRPTSSQTAEPTPNGTATRPQSLSSRRDDISFDIRDYLIDRCVTDTKAAAVAATAAADSIDDNNAIVNDVDKIDKRVSVDEHDVLMRSRAERSSTLPPVPASKRFSDSELVKRGYSTVPGRVNSTARTGASVRAKRHRWKLFRKALNLFSLDEAAASASDDDGGAGTDSGCRHGDGGSAVHPEEEQNLSQHLGGHSTSVESLPGSVSISQSIDHRSVNQSINHNFKVT